MVICYTKTVLVRALALLLVLAAPALAQEPDADELSRQTQNPLANLTTLPFQGNWDFGIGDRDATGTLFNIQPVMSFPANPSTNVILRVIIPMSSQPTPSGTRVNGISDTLATAFFSPSANSKYIWGAGPAVSIPTATNAAVGTEKFALGPSFVFVSQPGNMTFGFLGNQLWSVDGAKDREAVNQAFLQPFVSYSLGNGMSAGATIEATVQWEADNGKLTAPLLFNITKVTMLGKRPVSFQVAAGPMLDSPDGGAKWRFRVAATFLYPK